MEIKERKRPAGPKHRTAARKRKTARKSRADVVYTQPQPFNRRQFVLRLLTVIAVVLALTLGMSIFFKVEVVTVTGSEKYTAWDVRQASGIQDGENLLTLSKARIGGRIRATLPYVEQVRVGIKLPDTVHIEITELSVAYAIADENDTWWLMDAEGKLLEQITGIQAKDYTRILGVPLTNCQPGKPAQAVEPEAETVTQTDPSGATIQSTIPVTVLGSERLAIALSILRDLEKNGILGEMASVDVSDLGHIQLWYADRYQVELGDTTRLSYKVRAMKQAIDQMSAYQTGVLDVSFTIWPDQVGYTAFENE